MAMEQLKTGMAPEQLKTASPGFDGASVGRQAPEPLPVPAQRALTFGLLLSALRCTLQYIILPFVLPWVGVTTRVAPWVTVLLGALAVTALGRNVYYLWRLHHARRWSYLMLAGLVAATLAIFAVVDVHAILHL